MRFPASSVRAALLPLAMAMALSALGSHVGDSLRFLLEADASPHERAAALMRVATRRSSADPVGALGLLGEAARLASLTGDSALVHEVLEATGALNYRLGHRAEHMRISMRALRIAKHLMRPEWIAMDLQNIARSYRLREEPERAINEARNALAVAIQAEAHAMRRSTELLLMETLMEGGHYDEVQRVADRALRQEADEVHTAHVQLLMAQSLLLQQRPFDAQPLLVSAERVFIGLGDQENATKASLGLVRGSILQGRSAEARARLEQLEDGISALQSPALRMELLRLRHDLAISMGDHRGAHGLLLTLQATSDSLRRIDRDLVLSGMHTLYDVERKEQDNLDLRTENARHEAHIAGAARANQALVGAAAVFAGLSAVLLWLLWRHRRIARRSRLKSSVIARQRDEIGAKSLELERQNLRLREALLNDEQKELIIREIHHRVKNNLQVIDGLLSLHMGESADRHALKALREARGRLRAMALVHSAIHRHGGESALPMREHFAELARLVLVAHGRHDSLSIQLEVEDAMMDAGTLLPVSLLVNELITNSIKHSYGPADHGGISLSIRLEQDAWHLRYSDDGAALQDAASSMRPASVGMGLMRSLADQLEGEFEVCTEMGTRARLRFGHRSERLLKAS